MSLNEKDEGVGVGGRDAGQIGMRGGGGSDAFSSRNLASNNTGMEGSSLLECRDTARRRKFCEWQRELRLVRSHLAVHDLDNTGTSLSRMKWCEFKKNFTAKFGLLFWITRCPGQIL